MAEINENMLIEDQLAEMAADPDIQREIRLIHAEFAGTESDGLSAEQSRSRGFPKPIAG